MAAVVLLMGVALAVAAALVRDHRAAQSAADLAALAGARSASLGRDPCAAASGIATANSAELVSCRAEGDDLRVVVSVVGPRWFGLHADLQAEARAGPG
jgi:secretion/DNA translocation related TadE-like protein